jgi:hypothetical protein
MILYRLLTSARKRLLVTYVTEMHYKSNIFENKKYSRITAHRQLSKICLKQSKISLPFYSIGQD